MHLYAFLKKMVHSSFLTEQLNIPYKTYYKNKIDVHPILPRIPLWNVYPQDPVVRV